MSESENVQVYLNMFSEDNEKENDKNECSSFFSNNVSTNINKDINDNINQPEKFHLRSDNLQATNFHQIEDGNTNRLVSIQIDSNNNNKNSSVTEINKRITDRMLKRDSIYKKIKSNFFDFLYEKVNKVIKKDKKLSKLDSKTTINNVTSEFNKKLFNITLQQIYVDDVGLFETENDIDKFTETIKESDELKKILSTKLSDLFISYLNDETYGVDKIKITESLRKKNIKYDDFRKYIEILDSLAFQLLDYYQISN